MTKPSEHSITEEQRGLLSLFEQAPGFLCFLEGPTHVFQLANPAYMKLVGHRDILGKSVRDALPELVDQGFYELLDRIYETGEPFVGRGMQVRLQNRVDGPEVETFLDFVYQPIVAVDGSVRGILVQGHDVTEARTAEHARRSIEARYRTLFESIDDGFCIMQMVFDENDRCVDYLFLETNATFEQHTGLKNARGRTARELVPDLDDAWFQRYGQVARTGETLRFESHAPAMNRWFDVYASRVGEPEARQVALVFKNVTARKLTEAQREESEARFRNMADHAPVMMWVTDERGACTYLNRRWYEVTGQGEEAGLGLGWLDAVHPDDVPRARAVFLDAHARQSDFRVEYRLKNQQGGYLWAIDAAAPRFGPDGAFLGYVGSVVDISERKAAEDAREAVLKKEQEARAQAEDASRLKDEFLATVSHELRTPLSSILGWIQMLRTGRVAEAGQARALETIERNARAQAQLIEDLLDVSRILSGKLKLEVESVDMEHVVSQALESVRPAADAKEIRVQAALDSTCHVAGDPNRLQQVVWNLLSNAVKFTPKGGRVQVTLLRVESAMELSIRDSGRGIAPEFLPHVFERFRQAEAGTTRSQSGLGLGLSIVRHLVEAHGGVVSAHSEGAGQGATFVVRLPLSITREREPSLSVRPDFECPPELVGLRILVVDDESDARDVLDTLLTSCGSVVTTAGSAAQGLRLIEAQTFDLVVSDVGMPEQDGYAFVRMLRDVPGAQRLPAIALTAFTRAHDRTRALLAGFQSHVPKPVEPAELLAVIASLARDRVRAGA